MVFSTLEKVLLTKVGIDIARNPMGRATALRVAQFVAPVTVPVSQAVGGALTSPITGAAIGGYLGYEFLQTPQGQALLEAAGERGRADRIRAEQLLTDIWMGRFLPEGVDAPLGAIATKRKKSSFNAAVSSGMRAIKASKFMGKKGTLSNAKSAFSMVTKVASGLLKGRKAPKSGARRIAYRAMPKALRGIRKGR